MNVWIVRQDGAAEIEAVCASKELAQKFTANSTKRQYLFIEEHEVRASSDNMSVNTPVTIHEVVDWRNA